MYVEAYTAHKLNMTKIINFAKKEAVLCISALCAAVSMFFVRPSAGYADYIDLRVLCLLFCLMVVVLGLQSCGLFAKLAEKLLTLCGGMRSVSCVLVLLPFFTSMAVTNDVALITFVPFAIMVLGLVGHKELTARIIALQTVSANLGSMATPVGNPQNLYIYSHYELSAADFFGVLLPFVLVSFIGVAAASLCTKNITVTNSFSEKKKLNEPKKLAVYALLFALCLLSVFRLINYLLLTAIVTAAMLVLSPKLLLKADYGLLATFVCFFIFAGNLGEIEAVKSFFRSLLSESTFFTSAFASQLISNVPAALLLSGFTDDWRGLLAGVDIGGLGTPIASLASLISLKLYMKTENAKPLGYIGFFTAVCAVFFAVLAAMYIMIY